MTTVIERACAQARTDDKTEQLTLRIPTVSLEKVKTLAAANSVSVNVMTVLIVEAALSEHFDQLPVAAPFPTPGTLAARIDKVGWLPVRNRKVLFARSANQDTFFTVGGKREMVTDGQASVARPETDNECLIREVLEETGVNIVASSITFFQTFTGFSIDNVTSLTIAAYAADFAGGKDLQPCGEIAELRWLNSQDYHRTSAMGRTILAWLVGEGLID